MDVIFQFYLVMTLFILNLFVCFDENGVEVLWPLRKWTDWNSLRFHFEKVAGPSIALNLVILTAEKV